MVANMCVSYVCIFFFLLFALVFSLFAVLTTTICEYDTTLIDMIPTINLTVSSQDLSITAAKVNTILNCQYSANASSDNNFIDILGAESLFNLTSELTSATSQISSAKSSFSPNSQIKSAISQLSSLSNSTGFNISKNAQVSAYQAKLSALRKSLPPINMNRNNGTYRSSLQSHYLSSISISGHLFSWERYQQNITALNSLLAQCTSVPSGFLSNYTYQTMSTMTYSQVTASASSWTTDCSTYYASIKHTLTGTDLFTYAVNTAVQSNNVVQKNLTIVATAVDHIANSVTAITTAQSALTTVKNEINATLYTILDQADAVLSGLSTQTSNVQTIGTFVETAPQYSKCGFVGDFYTSGFKDGICGDFKTSLKMTWPFMLAAAVVLFVAFLGNCCFVRKPAWYLHAQDDPMGDGVALTTPARTATVLI